MPDETEGNDRAWLLEPLGANETRIHVDIGEGADISDEVRAALDELVEALHASDVEGFMLRETCPDLDACSSYFCQLGSCNPESKYPCFVDLKCVITRGRA